mmetsp:Transcript_24927/g.40401  ORF Transcript_24927/g.40401 Transcript_24927/m.40401 type:complete len:213 (-) Transcript_24927:3578-4216(-)
MSVVDEVLESTSLYRVLGVNPDIPGSELRKAYLKRSMKCHPDKCAHPRATEAFQHVAEAYEILSDPAKRSEYDITTNRGNSSHVFGQHNIEVTPEQAFNMFAQAMEQIARDKGINYERKDTVFDSLAWGFRYVDSWINPLEEDKKENDTADKSKDADKEKGENNVPLSRLQYWANNLVTMGTIVSTASSIVKAQREEREAEEKRKLSEQNKA